MSSENFERNRNQWKNRDRWSRSGGRERNGWQPDARDSSGQEGFGQGDWDQSYGNTYQGGSGQGGYTRAGYGPGSFYSSTVIVGRFSGRGPKGYRRSDDRIWEDVNEELTRNPDIDASEIEVRVENGEVTLTGKVEDRQQKRLAEDLAERCSGVRDIHNQLKVDKGFFAKLFGSDEEDREDRERERTKTRGRANAGSR